MADESPGQLTSKDFLNGEMTISSDEREENQRPLQLPRVGWGNDDEDEGDSNTNVAEHPTGTQEVPESVHEGDGSCPKRLSRSSPGDSDLASIPEDVSMHGTWPDYYPDILSCCDYDHDQKKYIRCGPEFRTRMCMIFLILLAALIGSRLHAKVVGKQNQLSVTIEDPDTTHQADRKNRYPPVSPGVDLYEVIVDTLQPIMVDGDQFQFTSFHAFEFCGSVYNRIPCPYIAYCPLGPGRSPLGGTKISVTGSWAPIYNNMSKHDPQHPDWVQLGRDGTCELYSELYNDPPPWDTPEGEQAEGVSRHVMCCLDTVDGHLKGGEDRGPSNDPYYLDRPPFLEEDELKKAMPMREEEERTNVDQSNKPGGNRLL